MNRQAREISEVLDGLLVTVVRQRPRDLSRTAGSTLARLASGGPRRLGELAVAERISQPSMSAVVGNLEQLGLAERRADPVDGRAVLVGVTSAGLEYVAQRRRQSASALQQVIDQLPDGEQARLAAALPALRHLVELAAERYEADDALAITASQGP